MQTVAALIAAAVDYERTLVLAIEVSNESWVLAAQVPGLPHTKAKRTINPDAESLMAAIAGYRARATATGHSVGPASFGRPEIETKFDLPGLKIWKYSSGIRDTHDNKQTYASFA